jgi:hypothetical protein
MKLLLLLLLVMRRLLLRMILRHDGISQKLKKLSDLNNAKKKPDKLSILYGCARIGTRHLFSKGGKSA